VKSGSPRGGAIQKPLQQCKGFFCFYNLHTINFYNKFFSLLNLDIKILIIFFYF
jgi:hypothetical protein